MTERITMTLREVLLKHRPHRGLKTSHLLDKLAAAPSGTDPWRLDLTDSDRRMLGQVLAEDPQPPTEQEPWAAVELLVKRRLHAQLRYFTREIDRAERQGDQHSVADLLLAKRMVMSAVKNLEETC